MALAELIDNSIQADSENIRIILIERIREGKRRTWNVDEILIVDDGHGMSKDETMRCLRFGGGTRHGAKKGLGKFGFGLPNSSASQCPRFEVYTWQNPSVIYRNYFDFNEIYKEKTEFLPEVEESNSLPGSFSHLGIDVNKNNTVIRWIDCDRLSFKTGGRLAKHIEKPVGRIFRHFINDGLINIKIDVYQDNGDKIS
ncbi:MAG: ATP-binding protein [Balneolaceae bacterium]|nr:ATP-binding protein [Balneolaceae bacterium]